MTPLNKISYGVGQLSDGIKTAAFSTFLFFYYNQVLGLSGSLAGLVALLALVVDAITDPMVGSMSDRFRSRWGRRHPFMLMAIVPFTLTMVALFSPPASLTEQGLFWWMLIWAIAVRICLTLFYVPHLSLGAELVSGYHQRTDLIGYRVFFSYLGSLLISVVGFLWFFRATDVFENGMLNAAGYPKFAVCAGLLGSGAMLWSLLGTRKAIPSLAKAVPKANSVNALLAFITVFRTLKQPAFRILFFTVLLFMTVAGINLTLIIYVVTYLFEFGTEHLALLSSSVLVSIIIAPTIAKKVSRKVDKKKALAICVSIGVVIVFAPTMLYLAGQFHQYQFEFQFWLVFLTNGIAQGFFIAYLIIVDSMLTDTIDYHEMETGEKEEGLFFAARALVQKASYGLGSFFAGIALDIIQFPDKVDPQNVPPEVLTKLAIVAGPVGFVLYLATILISRNYPLDSEKSAQVMKTIADRNNNQT